MAAKRGRSISNVGYGLFAGLSGGLAVVQIADITFELKQRDVTFLLKRREVDFVLKKREVDFDLKP